jgi:hypothetical protein
MKTTVHSSIYILIYIPTQTHKALTTVKVQE